MSLTRDEWIKMWECIKRLEFTVIRAIPMYKGQTAIEDINMIKDKIQSVIGQMEPQHRG